MPITDKMPTIARLVSAASLGAVGWYASELFRPLMPPQTDFGWFNHLNVILGFLCGWIVVGSRLGRGYSQGISAGLTGGVGLVFWALFFQSFNEMLDKALERRYDGPVEALTAIFEIGVDFALIMLNGPLIGFLVGGAVVTGLVSEWVSRRLS